MDRAMQGIDCEAITWIKCSERMPPDDETMIICMYGNVMIDKFRSNIVHAACKLSEKVNGRTNIKWTPYTPEAWKLLNPKID